MKEKKLQNCGKCGLCLNACPVYKILKEEQVSPRAKLHLIKAHDQNTIASSAFLKEIISKCLMCGSCSAVCPSGIDHYSKFMEMRRKMGEAHGEAPAIKSLIYLLAREYRTGFGAGLARTGQKLVPAGLAKKFKLGNIPIKNFPELNPVPFRKAHDEVIFPKGKPAGRVIYFTGCATNYLYEDTGDAVIGILTHMGYEVVIPKTQTCCSIPLLFHGAKDRAMENITANIKALRDIEAEAVLVDCSTCGEALKNEYPRLFEPHDEHLVAAQDIALRVTDIISFINLHFDLLQFDPDITGKIPVTYHAPCHTRNTFSSHLTVEKILQAMPSVDYRQTPDSDQCCGGGGTFFYEYPEVSKKMVDKKIESAKAVEVSHWLTDCPVCRMNLAGNTEKKDGLTVLHPVTLIHAALKQI
ncbi:MAG: hypothetical protein A2277_02600 [Desulfobacterales bacterium RIFOXYA12_FULL_46_15]|nr:MAG: hypothetical protein A2097_10370 [Desulfobacula sp. GWF2_41_7]OGR25143.1 MAG: hypothetical protein A2277_02600 [Desulfobacterales bacterium RIFOXYA12_FULL_46_15]